MDNIHIKGVHEAYFVPTVNFDASTGICELAGESYLEETTKFYQPLFEWIKEYTDTVKGPLIFNFKLSYFNTSSSKCLVDILDMLKNYQKNGGSVTVNWYYDDSDEELEEVEDFTLETGLEINKIPISDED
ncbi:MAG: DUF1987 domain-containing protein [Bacteroidales bacterium]|nr:DUF1987 domain-containing protein [Bacteroidales bacterium]